MFAFGPVVNPVGYHEHDFTPFDTSDARQVLVRSPGAWLTSVQGPTWVIEGTRSPPNIAHLP